MFTVDDFVLKYENNTDEELMAVYRNISGYSEEAQKAVAIMIEKRGGQDTILNSLQNKQLVQDEIDRIAKETHIFGSQGIDADFIKTVTTSAILSEEKVKEIIDKKHQQVSAELEDKKINPRTIVGSVIGGAVASITGGILWSLQLIFSHAVFYILFFGLIIFCYGIIKLSTRQSHNNKVVTLATMIAIVLALVIGQLLYEMIGYRG